MSSKMIAVRAAPRVLFPRTFFFFTRYLLLEKKKKTLMNPCKYIFTIVH